jgi:hypothetical protein
MADLSDVENSLTNLIYEAVLDTPIPNHPNVRVSRGWITATAENIDIANGVINITVYSMPGSSRNITRYTTEWYDIDNDVFIGLSATINSNQITFVGSILTNQIIAVIIGQNSYVYTVQASDTINSIVTLFSNQIPNAIGNGAVLTLPTDYLVNINFGNPIIQQRELERQDQEIRVTLWCPTPESRDDTARIIGGYLAQFDFLKFSDGSYGEKKYWGTFSDDVPSKEKLWKRDLRYQIEYATTQNKAFYPVLVAETGINTIKFVNA